ncbi:homoserine dehydrogenase [Pseudonocardia sp. ICBG1293]|uniref:homoserine dehydrogenase n=1 Tax=Pseudonocardia sp. ICBG1293 TaxID=2844382 RepID=UPI001CC9F85A|nr:homoserine dehydrogenase [Pseudonocardia sp. ICBG1293]
MPPSGAPPVRYALTGARGGFGRTLLAQTRHTPRVAPDALCDLDVDGTVAMCRELGFRADDLAVCRTADEVAARPAGTVAVVPDLALLTGAGHDVLVEATGSPAAGYRAAVDALEHDRHVVMVSKEVETVVGTDLARRAADRGLGYVPGAGDQPANLVGWYARTRELGLEVVAAGKSGEYDLVLDPATGRLTHLDQQIDVADPERLLAPPEPGGVRRTLDARADAVATIRRSAAADLCEMAVVADATGLVPDVETLHYPVARVAELADVYARAQDGGVTGRTGVVDVFTVLRRPDEASFAGGVFVVVRTHDPVTWETLSGKGHVVSRDGRYACLYLPYHLMGVETPLSVLAVAERGAAAAPPGRGRHVVLAGRARTGLPAGRTLAMGGHHHDVDGVAPVLFAAAQAPDDVAPLYLAAHARLARDVPAGAPVRIGDLADPDPHLLAAWRTGATC